MFQYIIGKIMSRLKPKFSSIIFVLTILLLTVFHVNPVYAESLGNQSSHLPTLAEFSTTMENSNANQVTGVYVQDLMAVPVLQQPAGQAGYVSTKADIVTQFAAASKYGTIGLLAHNYLAGAYFSELSQGKIISLVYGDGKVQNFRITSVKQYQALSPNNPYSQFMALDQPGVTLSSSDLFRQTYGLGNVLILQTCISKGSESSWGRLFIIAEQVRILPVRLLDAKNLSHHLVLEY
jgi:hypothetical protein